MLLIKCEQTRHGDPDDPRDMIHSVPSQTVPRHTCCAALHAALKEDIGGNSFIQRLKGNTYLTELSCP